MAATCLKLAILFGALATSSALHPQAHSTWPFRNKSIDSEAQQLIGAKQEKETRAEQQKAEAVNAQWDKVKAERHLASSADAERRAGMYADIAKRNADIAERELRTHEDRVQDARQAIEKAKKVVERAQEEHAKAAGKLTVAEEKLTDEAKFDGQIVTDKMKQKNFGAEISELNMKVKAISQASQGVNQAERTSEYHEAARAAAESNFKDHLRKLEKAKAIHADAIATAQRAAEAAITETAIKNEAADRKTRKDKRRAAKHAAEKKPDAAEKKPDGPFKNPETAKRVITGVERRFAQARNFSEEANQVVSKKSDLPPTKFGCWFKRPTGCGASKDMMGWKKDSVLDELRKADSEGSVISEAKCLQRLSSHKKVCNREDVQVLFVGPDAARAAPANIAA